MSDEQGPQTCCLVRRKIVVGIIAVLPEDLCGVPDTELADVLRFDIESPCGKPVLSFLYCPWCGKPRRPGDEYRITTTDSSMDEEPWLDQEAAEEMEDEEDDSDG